MFVYSFMDLSQRSMPIRPAMLYLCLVNWPDMWPVVDTGIWVTGIFFFYEPN